MNFSLLEKGPKKKVTTLTKGGGLPPLSPTSLVGT